MHSVADDLRQQTHARVLAMPVRARIALALSLGDQDVERYARHNGLERDEARRRLHAGHAQGRSASHAASFDDR